MIKVAVIISPGFEEIEAITPIDILRRAEIEVVTLGLNSLSIKGAHSITLQCDFKLEDFNSDIDGIIIPGGMPGALNISESFKAVDLIHNTYRRGKLVGAICASPGVVLGKTEILNSREFTCYPSFEDRVSGGIYLEKSVVISDNVVTSRGPGTAMEFSLAVVKFLVDKKTSETISKALLFPKTF